MSKKTESQRAIDVARGVTGGPGEILTSTTSVGAPAVPIPPAPTDLAVGTITIGRSSASAIALVPLTWRAPAGVPPARYLVEVGADSGFTNIVARVVFLTTTATLELATSRTLYARVYAQYGAQTSAPSASVTITTPADTTPAGLPTSAAASFTGPGDLVVTCTNPTDENFRDVEVRIWDSASKVTLLATDYFAGGRYVWTAAANRAATSGVPDPVLYVELRSRTWAGVLGTTVVVGTATKSRPATPSGLSADFTGVDCVITWTTALDAVSYQLTIDGVARTVVGGRYVLTYDQNRQEHAGTADPVLTLSLVAVDGLDQTSATPATATATNAAPSAPSSVTLTKGFSAFMVVVAATEPADFQTYRWRIIQTSPAASDVIYDSRATLQTREAPANATYQVGVRVVDLFGQTSAETLSSAVGVDALSLDDLRLDLSYLDSVGTSAATLATLKDGVTASGGVTYAA